MVAKVGPIFKENPIAYGMGSPSLWPPYLTAAAAAPIMRRPQRENAGADDLSQRPLGRRVMTSSILAKIIGLSALRHSRSEDMLMKDTPRRRQAAHGLKKGRRVRGKAAPHRTGTVVLIPRKQDLQDCALVLWDDTTDAIMECIADIEPLKRRRP